MKLKALFAAVTLSLMTSIAFAGSHGGDATLKDDVDAEVKAAIESALAANEKAVEANFEWLWASPVRGMWKGSKQTNSKILVQAIEMANNGENDKAKSLAAFIETAANEGLKQAELSKNAGPRF